MVDKITTKIPRAGRSGFSLLELLVVITVITLMVAGMITVANHVQLNAKIKNTKITITILGNALEEYKAFKGENLIPAFPLDTYSSASSVLKEMLRIKTEEEFGIPDPSFDFYPGDHDDMVWDDVPAAEQAELRVALSGIEFLYYSLDDVPTCQDILKGLPSSVVTNDDRDFVFVRGQEKTLKEVNDAWGHPIQYRYTYNVGAVNYSNFPVLTSAGEDGDFGTADDIISSEF